MSRLRVAIVSRRVHPAHGPGGLERAVFDQCVHLAAAGVAIELVSETPSPARRRSAERMLGEVARLRWVGPGPLPIGRVRGTVILDRITNYPLWSRRAARAVSPGMDVVHAHGLGALGAARARRAGRLGAPLLLATHGMEEFVTPQPLKRLAYAPFRAWMREAAAVADRIVVTDESLLERVESCLRVPVGKLVVIPNAVAAEAGPAVADPAAARALLGGAADASLLLLSVGRIDANKGFDDLAAALGEVASELPAGWKWVLVGDGPARASVERAVARAGIASSVLLTGRLDENVKQGLMALAHWFVHPTRYEGSSLVTLEAMSHGLPVLATRTGGLPDKVRHERTGLLVPPATPTALAAALRRLPELDGVAMGRAGRALLEERFDWSAAARAYVDLYAELARK